MALLKKLFSYPPNIDRVFLAIFTHTLTHTYRPRERQREDKVQSVKASDWLTQQKISEMLFALEMTEL